MTTALLASLGGAAVGLGMILLAPEITAALPRLHARAVPGRDAAVKAAIAGLAGAIVWGLTGWPVAAALVSVAAWWLPRVLGPDRATGAEVERIEAVAGWAEQLRDLIAAASGLRQAIWASVPIAPLPIRADVHTLAQDLTDGADLDDALTAFAHRVGNDTADLVATALSMATRRHAADLGTLLGTLAEAARDRASMLTRTSASRARTRTSVRIIIASTVGMVVAMAVFNGPYFAPLGSVSGQLVLALVGGVWAGALWWLVRLSSPQRAQRLLAPKTGGTGV
ncbi:Flp pilus assembly protein TadB [Nocardiopsis sp. Huas11]|uniref:type II secretion system F family protein n=1 Tax=Nocardiopsis sp. Huas11 TaxID=2183912 RepID=UPI000EAE84EE|nr:hypothetical protein [Nocardiopsis sp. Huas11]RKS05995.1 Flp pilus assembly protein TadB [Nocardiopsis sp. Huas11]